MFTTTNSGFVSPQPSKPSDNTESPAQAILVSPAAEGVRTFHFTNKLKTLGETPNKTNVIKLNKNQIGHAHLITNPLGTNIFITDETCWSEENKLHFGHQYTQLLTQLKSLRNRSDTEYKFKEKGSFSPAHIHAAQLKISNCIAQLKLCLTLAPNSIDFLCTLNQSIQAKAFYNPFGLEKMYKQNSFDLDLANNDEIAYARIEFKDLQSASTSSSYSGSVASNSSKQGFFCAATALAPLESPIIHSEVKITTSSAKLWSSMVPSSVLNAKRKRDSDNKAKKTENTDNTTVFSSTL